MGNLAIFVLVILLQSLMFNVYCSCLNQSSSENVLEDSSPFPSDFLFGTASSAYQVLPLFSFISFVFMSSSYYKAS